MSALLVLGPVGVSAQEAAPAPERERPVGLEEIVVTAERREADVQDIGQAIEAFSQNALERQGIEDIHDLAVSVPSLVVTGGLAQPTLRGVSSEIVAPGVDSGMALHVNGFYAPQLATALLDFFDMERVEVLYGPQGTLYGRSSTGGAFNFITASPKNELELWGDVEVNDREKVRVRSVFNYPFANERLRMRFAYQREWPQEDYKVRGQNGNKQELESNDLGHGSQYRLSLSYDVSEKLAADFVVSYLRDNTTGGGVRFIGSYPAYPAGLSRLLGSQFDSPDYTGTSGVACSDAANAAARIASCAQIFGTATPNETDERHINQDRRQSQRYETFFSNLVLTYEADSFTFKSITNYQDFDFIIDRDQDSSDLDIQRLVLEHTQHSYGQEFLLTSAPGERFEWLLGTNYTYDKQPDTSVPIWDYQVNADAVNFQIFDALTFAPVNALGSALPDTFASIFDLRGKTRTQYFGAFGNLWYNVTDRLRLSAGLRHSSTRREFKDTSSLPIFLPTPALLTPGLFDLFFRFIPGTMIPTGLTPENTAFVLDAGDLTNGTRTKTWKSLTWRVGAEYYLTDENMLYASVSTGESHGGFNWLETGDFDSEEIFAIEAGSKNRFFDNRLQANLSLFWYDYEDKFIVQTLAGGSQTITTNAPSAEVFGAEFSFIAQPTERIRLNGNVGWLHAEYDETFLSEDTSLNAGVNFGVFGGGFPLDVRPVSCGVIGGCTAPQNLKGNDLNRAPKLTVSVGVDYVFDLGDWGTVTPRIDYHWQDKLFFREFGNALDRQASYHRTDVRVKFEPEDGNWWLELYGSNLEDNEEIKTQLEARGSHRQWKLRPGRTFGLRTGYRFF